jgi:hypothetical protein
MLRRLLASTAALALVWSATLGFAASLRMHPATLAAASGVVSACDHDGVTVAYHLAWSGLVTVDRVEVAGIADRCVGLHLAAVLTGADVVIVLSPQPVRATRHDDNRVVVAVPGSVAVTGLDRIHIAIN